MSLHPNTWYKWANDSDYEDRRTNGLRQPPTYKNPDNKPGFKGDPEVEKKIVHYLKLAEFSGKSIKFVYEQLSTRGVYFASPSSWYRVARKHGLISKKKPVANKPKESTLSTAVRLGLVATKPNQVWNWDISYFPYKGGNEMVYLFAVIDLYSRKCVGAKYFTNQGAAEAVAFFKEVFKENGITKNTNLHMHSDNGSAMRSAELMNLFNQFGVTLDTNRPYKSNDNAHAETFFGTLKGPMNLSVYDCFSVRECNKRLDAAVYEYNYVRLHSGINSVPPAIRHEGNEAELAFIDKVRSLHKQHFHDHPSRYPHGRMKEYKAAGPQYLNPSVEQVLRGLEIEPENKVLLEWRRRQLKHKITEDRSISITFLEEMASAEAL